MEQRVAVLQARKQESLTKLEKLKQEKQELQKSLVERRLSDWNRECLSEMNRGLVHGLAQDKGQGLGLDSK